MQELQRRVEPETVALIERTVRESMSPYALRTIDVRAGEDHDGDPVIFVEVQHDLSETPIDPAVNAKLSSDLWRLLLEAGESRFRMSGTSITSNRRSRLVGGGRLDCHGTTAGPGRSHQAASVGYLKRFISTAYYALFHAIGRDAADLLVGGGPARSDKAWAHTYRGLEHGFAKNACKEVPKLGFPIGITGFAREFIELQEVRHNADYDPRARFSRAEALQWAARAEAAIAELRAAPRRDRKAFAVQLLLRMRS
jgi:hypothetical protein